MLERTSARSEVLATAARDLDPTLVAINTQAIASLTIPAGDLTAMTADVAPGAATSLESALRYLLMVNALNFRFWDVQNGQMVRYAYEGVVGALGMRRAFARAWGEQSSSPVWFWAGFSRDGVRGLFGDIPAIADREAVLNEICDSEAKVAGLIRTIADTMRTERTLTMNLARTIAEALPESYGDAYLKKAQLTLTEMASFCTQWGISVSVSDFTLFADYQLPRVLRALGILTYQEALAAQVDGSVLIEAGSAEVRAIRAATIVAGEEISQRLGCSAAVLDNFLWCQRASAGKAPFHLTPTRAY